MPYTLESLPPEDAKRMLAAGEAMADSLGIPYNIAVVDAGGHLAAFTRQDGGLIESIDLAIDKATTSRSFDKSTADWQPLRNPASPCSAYRKVMPENRHLRRGVPVVVAGKIVGAVGASAGTVEQDIAVAEAAIAAFSYTTRQH